MTTVRQAGKPAQWDSTLTQDRSNPTDKLDQVLGPNLITRVPLTFRSNLDDARWLARKGWGYLLISGPKLAFEQPKNDKEKEINYNETPKSF